VLALGVIGISCETVGAAGKSPPQDVVAPQPSPSREPAFLTDRLHDRISSGVLKTAETIDAFFYAPQTEIEENRTTLKINLDLFSEAGARTRLGTGSRLKLLLPGFQDRIHLVLAGDAEDDEQVFGEELDEAPETTNLEEDGANDGLNAAVRYFVMDDLRRNLSVSAGMRLRDNRVVGYPELRYRRLFDTDNPSLAFRFGQRLLWYTDEGWRETSRFDTDLLLGRWLWRGFFEGVMEEKTAGYRYNLGLNVFQPVGKRSVLRYEWLNAFDLCTPGQLREIRLSIRYRHNFWRPWLFYEVVPQLSFPESDDFEATPGILLRLEAIFGHFRKRLVE
jgi:hypothetical protein